MRRISRTCVVATVVGLISYVAQPAAALERQAVPPPEQDIISKELRLRLESGERVTRAKIAGPQESIAKTVFSPTQPQPPLSFRTEAEVKALVKPTDTSILAAALSDADGDGWARETTNEQWTLYLTSVKAVDKKASVGCDTIYVIVDNVRFPAEDSLQGTLSLCQGQRYTFSSDGVDVARRVRDANASWSLNDVDILLYDDDSAVEVYPPINWDNDDLMFSTEKQLSDYGDGDTFTITKSGGSWPNAWTYELKFRVELRKFSDPNPSSASADGDVDGFSEAEEFNLCKEFFGVCNLFRQDIWVEVDYMDGHELKTNAKRMLKSQYYVSGYDFHADISEKIPSQNCLERHEIRDLWETYFQKKSYRGYHYAIIGKKIYNGASGVSWYDTFVVDDSYIDVGGALGSALGLAGTFFHELGHQIGLVDDIFGGIDSFYDLDYDSSMNYWYQVLSVMYSDYDSDGSSGNDDFDDWDHVNLKYSYYWDYGDYSGSRDTNPDTNGCL